MMKKSKKSKALVIVSLIILIIGIACWFGIECLIDDSYSMACFSSKIGVTELKLFTITITVGLISLIWLIYGIAGIFKKNKDGKGKYKNLLIVGASLLALILLVLFWVSTIKMTDIGFRKINYDYNIIYENGFSNYNIYKTGDEIEVYIEEQVICTVDPCPKIKTINKIEFSDKNMKIVNEFIDSFFTDQEDNTIQIYKENLSDEQLNILESIIRKDESLLKKDNTNLTGEYTIITDMRWKTMQNDGGSHTSIYYKINLNYGRVIKIEEDFHANLGGTPTTDESVIYTKKLDDELTSETKTLIEDLISKEDIKTPDNYNCFTIESENTKKDIYNVDTIKKINELLTKIDNVDVELVFSLQSQMLKCPSPTLYVYSDGTYEYFYTYSYNDKKIVPKTGTYDYDTDLILKDITNYEVDNRSSYALTDSDNKLHVLADYKPLDDFLDSIGINIHTCTEMQK